MDWLLERDVSAFNPAGHPPMTPWKRDIIRQSGGDVLVRLRELMEANSGPFQLPLIRTDDVRRMVLELKDKSDPAISSALKELGCKKPAPRVAKKINGKSVELNVYCTSEAEALNANNAAKLFDFYWQERLKVLPPPDDAIVPDSYRPALEELQVRSQQERRTRPVGDTGTKSGP